MIELFSRNPGTLDPAINVALTPITVEDNVVSLSVILLDDGYYEALQSAKRVIQGVTIVDERLLIPLKARAFLDLRARADAGEKVDSKQIKKHLNDVFRLTQLLRIDTLITLHERIQQDLRDFIAVVQGDNMLDLKALNIPFSRDEAIALLRSTYIPTGG